MKKWLVFLIMFVICLIPLLVWGDAVPAIVPVPVPVEPIPSFGEIFKDISELIRNFKAMGLLGSISAIILIIVKLLKTKLVGGWFNTLRPGLKRALVVVLGVISGIIISITGGVIWWEALVAGLISSGGAIVIYEVFKPLFKKA